MHVLGTPPAFVLSQDQTLEFNLLTASPLSAHLLSLSFSNSLRFNLQSFPIYWLVCFFLHYIVFKVLLPSRSFAAPFRAHALSRQLLYYSNDSGRKQRVLYPDFKRFCLNFALLDDEIKIIISFLVFRRFPRVFVFSFCRRPGRRKTRGGRETAPPQPSTGRRHPDVFGFARPPAVTAYRTARGGTEARSPRALQAQAAARPPTATATRDRRSWGSPPPPP